MISKTARILTIVVCIAVMCGIAAAQTPPNPVPDPGGPVNVYYGATPSNFNGSLPLVFVHGLDGEAQDWWVGNNMYAMMYQAGYKTCFININVDGTRSKGSVASDAQVLAGLFPGIAARFGVPQFTLITHSKGANDSEAAMLTPSVSQFVNAVYQISPPNEGTQLANWAFGPGIGLAAVLGLLSPGVYGLQTSAVGTFRKVADPIFAPLEIPFYYSAGDTDKGATIGGIVTAITGTILAGLTGNEPNDGLVPVPNTVLPVTYGVNLGLIDANHFTTLQGSYSFDRTNAQIQAATNNQGFPSNGVANQGFELAAPQGFGDRNNSLAWSQAWFQGKLYVGTGRAFACVQAAASDALSGTHYYSQNLGATIQCTPTPQELPLQAEIWQYTPENNTWVRVYQSPNTVPVAWDSNGTPTQYTALDIGYRGMGVFQEPTGPALYIGGVSASEMFDQTGPYATGTPFPGPRILRTTDGVNFAPIPMDPGTFLGGLGNLDANDRVRSYRTFVSYSSSGGGDAKTTGSSSLTASLFVTAADFYGTGVVIQSSQPWLGNNAWFQVTPPKAQMPVWNLAVFNNYLYAVGGDRLLDPNAAIGYFLSKTTATGPAPYNWIPVITEGGFQSDQTLRSPDALSIAVFNNAIYIGSDRPAEMLRAYADDTFDVVVGLPRMTPQGMKYPLSGITTGFGNFFTGHFWRMTTYNNELYMSTSD